MKTLGFQKSILSPFLYGFYVIFLISVFKIFTPAINLVTLQKIRREQREQQEKELLEKRQQFKEATKNLLVFAPEEQAPKEKPPRGRKVISGLFSLKFLYWPLQMCPGFNSLFQLFAGFPGFSVNQTANFRPLNFAVSFNQ